MPYPSNPSRLSELDLFIRQALMDPASKRVEVADDAVSRQSRDAANERMRKRVRDLLLLTFNEADPSERLSMVCGRSVEWWRAQLRRRMSKEAARLLATGLRAHIMGIRDHLNDIEVEVRKLTSEIEESRDAWRKPPCARPRRAPASHAQFRQAVLAAQARASGTKR